MGQREALRHCEQGFAEHRRLVLDARGSEAALVQVLADEPDFAGVVYVAEVELPASEN